MNNASLQFLLGKNGHLLDDVGKNMDKTDAFFLKVLEKFPEFKYDFSKFTYTLSKTKSELVCPQHGSFFIAPEYILRGQGCKTCSNLSRKGGAKKRYNKQEFLDLLFQKVGECPYDLSDFEYKNYDAISTAICHKHGKFDTSAIRLLKGHGCIKCASEKKSSQRTTNHEVFVERIKEKFPDFRYDLSQFRYTGYEHKSTLICPDHGPFEIMAGCIIKGVGCRKCRDEKMRSDRSYTQDEFLNVFYERYPASKLNLDNFSYKVNNSKSLVSCENGHEFLSSAQNLIKGTTCPHCRLTRNHKELYDYIVDELSLECLTNDRTILNNNLELDLVIPSKKLAIEINGNFWHSFLAGRKDKNYHLNKTDGCKIKDIQLLHFFESELLYNLNICKSIIRAKVNIFEKRIYARKCTVRNITTDEERLFLNKNHLQGYTPSAIKFGMFFNDEMVSIMTFGKPRYNNNYEWEMLRFCSKLNTSTVGSANKILSHFRRTYNPKSIISYANKRFSSGHLYDTLNFKKIRDTEPSYFYVKRDNYYNLLHRSSFTKKRALKMFAENSDLSMTEWEIMQHNNYDKIYDCGTSVYGLLL